MSSTPSPRQTQYTIQTSTPVTGRTPAAFISSPSVSTCSSGSAQRRQSEIVRHRSDSSDEDSCATSAVTVSFLDDEDESTLSVRRRRVFTKSKDFLEFQPKREGGLYKKLIEEGVDGCETTTNELLLTLKTRPHAGLLTLFEYFLDLCGFQHIDFKEIYNSSDIQLETIINMVQNNISTMHKNGKYLMRAKTTYPEKVVDTVYCFIEHLVMNDDRFVLLHVNKPNNVLKFISLMCSSKHRAICHTGTIIAIKMNSAYSMKCYELNTAVNSSFSVRDELRTITEIQKNLWRTIERVCHTNDRFLEEMRRACAKEMLQWFKKRPEHFFESEIYIDNFLQFCVDLSAKVRLAALETCKKLFGCQNPCYGYLNPFENRIISEVIKRIDDIDLDVITKAVDICTCLLNSERNVETVAGKIPTLMLCKYYPLAAASGRFFITFLRHTKEIVSASDVLNGIVRAYKIFPKNYNNEVALIVEATLDCIPELQNWNLFIDSLLSAESDLTADKYFLLEFFCQSILQTVTGKCDVARKKPRRADPRKSVNKRIVGVVTPHFCTFLDLYGKRKQNGLLLLKTINVMHFSYLEKTEQNEEHMTRLYDCLIRFFRRATDMDLALKTLTTIRNFCDTNNHFQKQAIEVYGSLENEILESFINNSILSADLKTGWLRLAVAMETTDIFKKICWTQIFTNQFRDNVECLKYQMVACKWFIYHQTRELLQSYSGDRNNTALSEINKEIQEYAKYLFDLLVGDVENIALEAFKQICEMKVLMDEILQEPIKINRDLSILCVTMSDEGVVNKFCDILQKYMINTTSAFDLKTRKMYLNYAFHWLLKGEPLKHLHKIIGFYGEYYEEFGDIFDDTLKFIKTNAPLTLMVVVHKALIHVFDQTRFNMNDLLHSMKEATALKKLVKQIVQTCVQTAADALKIIQFSIKYILKNVQYLHFFFVLTYFVEHLGADDCVVLYENLKTEIPQQHQNHLGFLNFMLAVKNKTPKSQKSTKGRSRKTVRSEKSSTSTSAESYSIQDDSD